MPSWLYKANALQIVFILKAEIVSRFNTMRTTYQISSDSGKRAWSQLKSSASSETSQISTGFGASHSTGSSELLCIWINFFGNELWILIWKKLWYFFYESHPELWDHKTEEYTRASKSNLIDLLVSEFGGVFSKFSSIGGYGAKTTWSIGATFYSAFKSKNCCFVSESHYDLTIAVSYQL